MLATTGANFGARGALPAILGIQADVFVQSILMCVGLGSVFMAYPLAQQVRRIAGSLYLVFLAWKLSGASVGGAHAHNPTGWSSSAANLHMVSISVYSFCKHISSFSGPTWGRKCDGN